MQTSFRPVTHSFFQPPNRIPRYCVVAQWLRARHLTTAPPILQQQEVIPLRKHLKDEQKRKKASSRHSPNKPPHSSDWELTVGIEIHAELNTSTKLFSPAPTATHNTNTNTAPTPNTNVAPFDAALPGTQPTFQPSTLLPALRAALALNCQIKRHSTWDRKHYFHWDQPNGYQITQYSHPFATNGKILLTREDVGSGHVEGWVHGDDIEVGIKQVQMEQDTAKTTQHFGTTAGGHDGEMGKGNVHHVDLNRAGVPLIEVISLPVLHSARAAAGFVRKVQAVLKAVGACVVGMEMGGLRADVNVSVKRRGSDGDGRGYAGVQGLGQRTEIKNLSSFKAVEDAIIAERDRQIGILEAGGVVEGETRGWSLGATETTRLRGKEGEVDYRYMPDPDLPPLIVGDDLVEHLRQTLPELPDQTVARIQEQYGLSSKDARSLVALDDGDRLEFMEEIVELVHAKLAGSDVASNNVGKIVGNWVLHEVGGLLTTSETAWEDLALTPKELADIISQLLQKHITARVAKQLLANLHDVPIGQHRPTVEQLIEEGNLRLRPLDRAEYFALAQGLVHDNPEMAKAITEKGQKGKIMWFVGQMIRNADEGTVEPETARAVFDEIFTQTSGK